MPGAADPPAPARSELGRTGAALARLRNIVQQPEWIKDEEAQSFLREAERLIGGKAPVPKK
jgi:hypothetical protein